MNPDKIQLTRRSAMAVFGASAAVMAENAASNLLFAAETRRAAAYREKYRPQFHFTARRGWINDPNGLVYDGGWYHLFFQYVRDDLTGGSGGTKSWGHAISRDMVHWRQLPEALAPDSAGGIWSGSAVVDWHNTSGLGAGGRPPVIAVYTAAGGTSAISRGKPFVQCLAWSHDGGMTLHKYRGNPVLKQIVYGNRDPKVFWHAGSKRWIMPLFLNADRGFAILTSPDLKSWKKTQELHFPQSQECPNLFPLSDPDLPEKLHWIFTGANGQYLIGSFNGSAFTPHSGPFAMDTGNNFYASQVFSDIPRKDGRTIQITWMRGGRYPGMPFNQQLGFPCTLTLKKTSAGLRLARYPVAEISRLWRARRHLHNVPIASADRMIRSHSTDTMDLEMELFVGGATHLALNVGGVPVEWSARTKSIHCLGAVGKAAAENGRLHLRILLDRTSLELFAQGGLCSMSSCYLPGAGGVQNSLKASPGARVMSLALRPLHSAWHEST